MRDKAVGEVYAYIYKVIGEIGLCLIISVIHASGRGERGGARNSSWDKRSQKNRKKSEQGK